MPKRKLSAAGFAGGNTTTVKPSESSSAALAEQSHQDSTAASVLGKRSYKSPDRKSLAERAAYTRRIRNNRNKLFGILNENPFRGRTKPIVNSTQQPPEKKRKSFGWRPFRGSVQNLNWLRNHKKRVENTIRARKEHREWLKSAAASNKENAGVYQAALALGSLSLKQSPRSSRKDTSKQTTLVVLSASDRSRLNNQGLKMPALTCANTPKRKKLRATIAAAKKLERGSVIDQSPVGPKIFDISKLLSLGKIMFFTNKNKKDAREIRYFLQNSKIINTIRQVLYSMATASEGTDCGFVGSVQMSEQAYANLVQKMCVATCKFQKLSVSDKNGQLVSLLESYFPNRSDVMFNSAITIALNYHLSSKDSKDAQIDRRGARRGLGALLQAAACNNSSDGSDTDTTRYYSSAQSGPDSGSDRDSGSDVDYGSGLQYAPTSLMR